MKNTCTLLYVALKMRMQLSLCCNICYIHRYIAIILQTHHRSMNQLNLIPRFTFLIELLIQSMFAIMIRNKPHLRYRNMILYTVNFGIPCRWLTRMETHALT